MYRAATLSILFTAVSFLTAMPARAQSACAADSDHCQQAHTAVVAIAHSYTAPETTVLFRVKVAAWSPGKKWGDGHNGFFYRATAGTMVTDYTPFNGIRVGTDGEPALPPFDFIVPVDVSDGGTTLQIAACSSDPAAGSSSVTPQCTTTYWSDSYDPLPAPAVTPIPPVSVGFGTLTLGGSGAVSLANSGVYTDHIELKPDPTLTQAQLDWLFDHLVYFDAQGNAYTNDVLSQGVGILTLDEAAYVSPQDQKYHTKYGTGDAISPSLAPNQQLFFYTTLSGTRNLGISVIYDSSDTCTGYIANNGSQNVNCSTRVPGPPSITPQATVTGYTWKPTSESVTGTVAGTQERRTVQMQVQTAITDTSANCGTVLSPLAVAPSQAGGAQRPPNYVIDDFDWTRRFPNGLYYVLGTGFGNCDLSGAAPFCEQTNGGAGYIGYIPHYLEDGVPGTLNGGSNDGPDVTSMDLADEYELGDVGTATQNALVFFDSCGYGHRYEEPNVNVSLGTRKRLPDAPTGWTKLVYTVDNTSGRALVFGKECCASWYQPNDQTGQNEPMQQLGGGFGMFLPAGASIPYESLFRDEAIGVYDAATGEPLFKLRLDGSSSIVHSCSDPKSSVLISGGGSAFTVKIGATGSGAKKCQSIGKCPLGMTVSQSGSLVTCTTTQSRFLFGLDDWKAQASLPNKIQLRAYGANGRDAKSGDGVGGAHGFALTVYRPSDLPADLYAYVGITGSDHGDGGASTILTAQPLSLFGSDVAEATVDPRTMDVLLIAGGGGGDGTKHDGGNGGAAHANSSSLPGGAVPAHGADGMKDNGGEGGGKGSPGAGGSKAGKSGVGGTSHGTNAKWDVTGPVIPPTVDPLSWLAGHGAHGNASAGGGGFGGGGHGSTNAAGAGGGGSWAIGNTAYDSTAPTGRPPSPGGDNGAVEFDYVAPTAAVAPAALSPAAPQRNVVRFTFDGSVEPLQLSQALQKIFGTGLGGDVPVYIEAWGGGGGDAGPAGSGGAGGASGYARTAFRLADLLGMTNGNGLYIYVGRPGAAGDSADAAGQGGASTIVATQPLSAGGTSAPQDNGVLLIAGGGGGGGAATISGDATAQPGVGGAGGTAIATAADGASCGGADGASGGENANGGGGNGGGGSCDSPNGGGGGVAGAAGGAAGGAGIGGFGGVTGAVPSPPRWQDSEIAVWENGAGGASSTLGGAGGGGFGGGGSAGESVSGAEGAGGGGGGSWARQATIDAADAPLLGPLNPSGKSGAVVLTFDVCAVQPGSRFCTSGATFSAIDAQVRTFDEGGGQLRVRIQGSENLDVSSIDVSRLGFGRAIAAPTEVFPPADLNGDGIPDLELLVEAPQDANATEDAVHCLYGAMQDGTPFVGCSRVEAQACSQCAREECIDGACPAQASAAPESDSGCAIAVGRHASAPMSGLLLSLFGIFLVLARRRASRSALRGRGALRRAADRQSRLR